MRHPTALQSQRARRALSQEAMKRSHRRCDLIRLTPEDDSTIAVPSPVDAAASTDEPLLIPPLS